MKRRSGSRGLSTHRRLGIESLEARQMLSATVTAVLSGGNLTLTGNKNDAYVEVHETAADTLLITGLNGTKISYTGSTGTSETVAGVTGNLTVNLPGSGSGTQSFELDSAAGKPDTSISGNVGITMGNAADTATVQGPMLTIGGNLSIATGSGNQAIKVGKVENIGGGPDVTIDGSASITAGAGNSTATVVDTSVYGSGLTIKLGSGNGKVVVGSEADTAGTDFFDSGVLSITLGNGNGTVQVDNTQANGNLSVNTGNGNANISIGMETLSGDTDVLVGGYLYVHTCPGNTNVTILNTDVGIAEAEEARPLFVSPSSLSSGDLAVELGSGNNKVVIGSAANPFPSDVFVEGNAYVDDGSGNVTESIQSTTILGNLEMSHQSGNTTITIGAHDPYSEGSDVYVGGNAAITTSSGNASITIGGAASGNSAYISGTLTISTGTGNASISLTNDSVGENTSITTSSGNATVTLTGDTFYANLAVTLSSGNGSLTIKDTTVDGTTTLNGGGNGTLYYDGTDTFSGGLHQSHFKKVTT